MRKENFDADKRKMIIIYGICILVLVYIIRLFSLQVLDNSYKEWADSNAFLNKKQDPPRGVMYDRNGKLLVYNQPSYDVMVIMRETKAFDTSAFCRAVNIDKEYFRKKWADMKNRKSNPGYSSYTPQSFLTQLGNKECGILQESIYKFPGFYLQNKTIRKYNYPNAAHVLGYIAKADKQNLADDEYYVRGDYIGKTGVEKQYESYLRGTKGVEILLRDAHGRIKGKYEEGIHDQDPIPGKDLTLSLDIDLQAYGEMLMTNKLGSIIMIEPETGEILCMVSSPSYDPSILVGRQFSENFVKLTKDPYTPLINRASNGTYPPGSTFKPAQALVFLQEDIIQSSTAYSCYYGWPPGGGSPGCHGHASPLNLTDAIGTSCNSYFCWGLKAMLENKKYSSIEDAMDKWRDLMVSQGFGYPLGVDLPGEKRGRIPNGRFYSKIYARWNPFTVISIAIGQGEIEETPLQICNLAATIANRGYYCTPHVVKKIRDTSLDAAYTKKKYTGIAPEHYEAIVAGMRKAVTGGTSTRANIQGIEVCGKTGTAENKGKDHSVFMAFAPKDHPKVAISVLVENGGFGATSALPIARLMMEKYLNGQISELSKWDEERVKNTIILRNVVLPKKQYME
ncbi:MAG: penicillin-binding protein 2 [Dysgonamonadaceae bacterium]|jgi:penicillin-binding protein 2|nr:penicillin-binding protein 2 [Dysgonamonadaceae bacterium]